MTVIEAEAPSRGYAALPLQPLWDIARAMADMPEIPDTSSSNLGFTSVMFAEMVGHNVRAVTRWRETGSLPWGSADRAAVSLGLLPGLVWGDAWYDVKGDFAEIAAGKYHRAIESALDAAMAHVAAEQADELALEGLA